MDKTGWKVLLILLQFIISEQGKHSEAFLEADMEISAPEILRQALKEAQMKKQTNPPPDNQRIINSTYIYDASWPTQWKMNSISAVSLDQEGNAVIFQRAGRVWSQSTFNIDNEFTQKHLGVIQNATILAFNRRSGALKYSLGKNLFYMPHGLTVDGDSNIWVTDVALHQVMKLRRDQDKPLMVLGKKFKPGNSPDTFCKPTSVAVLPSGDFFVADGYCNARIIKFSPDGKRILTWGENSFTGIAHKIAPPNFLAIPHALTLALDKGLVCVADRENGRVQCFHASNGTFHSQYHSTVVGDRIYGVSYAPIKGGRLYVINGPLLPTWPSQDYAPSNHEVRGYVFDMETNEVVDKFGLPGKNLNNPHDLEVSLDGTEVYVGEIGEPRPRKFISTVLPRLDQDKGVGTNKTRTVGATSESTAETGATALVAVILIVVFAIAAFGATLLILRHRKRGCCRPSRKRKHAWELSREFKLGNLLDNKHDGFEKLGQEASDDEVAVRDA
ncbi:Peptidyl-alpha-hydroxyglycine alpha-amidating lyase 1 [Sergentomyia squamirostris]